MYSYRRFWEVIVLGKVGVKGRKVESVRQTGVVLLK